MNKKYYIAYGSNLNMAQMKFRCPDAVPCAQGLINGWRLVFRGSKTGSYASIVKSDSDCVPVGIWEISERDEAALDRYEGYPVFYTKEIVKLRSGGKEREALVYIINKDAKPGIPSNRYVKTCLQGYKDFALPVEKWDEAIQRNLKECKRRKHY